LTHLLRQARLDRERREAAIAQGLHQQPEGTRLETLAKFDDAVRTYINYKFGMSAITGIGAGVVLTVCKYNRWCFRGRV
jgi:predicted PurR-regulated permease PerM